MRKVGNITRRGLVAAAAAGSALGLARAAAQGTAHPPPPDTGEGGRGPSKVMVIRHAEKPDRDGEAPFGVGPDGRPDPHALLPRGWTRAGALARLFWPREGAPLPAGFARPSFILAAAATPEHASRRSMLTLSPLAELAGLPIKAPYGPDHEAEAAGLIRGRGPVALVAWEHRRIADLVTRLTGGGVPRLRWPGHRFDMVLVLDRDGPGWRLTQVPQMLLAGDIAEPFPEER